MQGEHDFLWSQSCTVAIGFPNQLKTQNVNVLCVSGLEINIWSVWWKKEIKYDMWTNCEFMICPTPLSVLPF